MPRKATATAATIAAVLSIPSAPESAAAPVVARKRARRAEIAAPVAPPVAAPAPPPPPPVLDRAMLGKMNAEAAKKAITAAYPAPHAGKFIESTPASSDAALVYLTARDACAIAEGKKEAAGNVLRLEMGDAETMLGEGFEVTWKLQKGEIDWGALAKELNIPSETIERFRKAQRRVLNVREKAE
jgi:hypothetical protein